MRNPASRDVWICSSVRPNSQLLRSVTQRPSFAPVLISSQRRGDRTLEHLVLRIVSNLSDLACFEQPFFLPEPVQRYEQHEPAHDPDGIDDRCPLEIARRKRV